jgi:hypothetical protein
MGVSSDWRLAPEHGQQSQPVNVEVFLVGDRYWREGEGASRPGAVKAPLLPRLLGQQKVYRASKFSLRQSPSCVGSDQGQ